MGETAAEVYQDGGQLCKEEEESNHILHLYISACKFRKHFHILFESSQQCYEVARTGIIPPLIFFSQKNPNGS